MNRAELHQRLQNLYQSLHRTEYLHPDPLETVLRFEAPQDQEITGLIAATLAYGRASQILISIERVLSIITPSPSTFLDDATPKDLANALKGFRHRWTSEDDMVDLLLGMKRAIDSYGSLENAFAKGLSQSDQTTLPALQQWVSLLTMDRPKNSLISNPAGGSACKRLHLYLRWMVRRDAIDPGPWSTINPAQLIIPLDTHMYRFARKHRMTRRKTPDGKTALQITQAFRKMEPEDPLKYDFVLTRLGIHPDLSPDLL